MSPLKDLRGVEHRYVERSDAVIIDGAEYLSKGRRLVDAEAEVERLQEAWEKDNLCGICPYRKAVQDENERLRAALRKADAEVAVLADALRAAGVAAPLVQAIIDKAVPRA